MSFKRKLQDFSWEISDATQFALLDAVAGRLGLNTWSFCSAYFIAELQAESGQGGLAVVALNQATRRIRNEMADEQP